MTSFYNYEKKLSDMISRKQNKDFLLFVVFGIKETALIPSTPFARHAPRKRLLDQLSEPSSIEDRYVC